MNSTRRQLLGTALTMSAMQLFPGISQAQARKLAGKPLSSLIATKRLMKSGQQQEVLQKMDEEGQSFGRMLREPAAKEAFGAFLEKRKPDFAKL